MFFKIVKVIWDTETPLPGPRCSQYNKFSLFALPFTTLNIGPVKQNV